MRRWLLAACLCVGCKGGAGKDETKPAPQTPSPQAAPAAGVTRDDCRAILEHSDQLIGQDPSHPRRPEKIEREIDECVAHATPEMVACAKAATTYNELKACEK